MQWAASFYFDLCVEGPAHSTRLSMLPEVIVRPTKEVVNFNIQRNFIKGPFFSTQPFTSRAFAYLHCLFLLFHLSIVQSCYADKFMGSTVLFCISCLRSILKPFVT